MTKAEKILLFEVLLAINKSIGRLHFLTRSGDPNESPEEIVKNHNEFSSALNESYNKLEQLIRMSEEEDQRNG